MLSILPHVYEKLLPNFALNFNLRHYNEEILQQTAAVAAAAVSAKAVQSAKGKKEAAEAKAGGLQVDPRLTPG
jgi:hypothetical protein